MSGFIAVNKAQVQYYKQVPLYLESKDGDFVLYKPAHQKIHPSRYEEDRCPQLFILQQNREAATKEVLTHVKIKLQTAIKEGNLYEVRAALHEMINEAFEGSVDASLQMLPDTVELLYHEYKHLKDIIIKLVDIPYGGHTLIEHCVNVTIFALNYGVYVGLEEATTKKICLAAMIHDIGLIKIPKEIVQSDKKLSDREFEIYKTHSAIGHDLVKQYGQLDPSIPTGILEHHERLDGSGYPRGVAHLSFEGRLLGMVDSFDNLTKSQKKHRKIKKPYEALALIKEEVLSQGQFDKRIFKDLCISLAGKSIS